MHGDRGGGGGSPCEWGSRRLPAALGLRVRQRAADGTASLTWEIATCTGSQGQNKVQLTGGGRNSDCKLAKNLPAGLGMWGLLFEGCCFTREEW